MRIFQSLLRLFFHLLYHQFAWAYDLVAALVSLGRWKGWVMSALPYLEGCVLEIGHGPGHLQLALLEHGQVCFGLDESRQMGNLTRRRLLRKGFPAPLTNGYAQNLPFPAETFDTLASTFPSGYIFKTGTLKEVRRVLKPGGKLVVIPMAWITGRGLLDRLAAWSFRASREVEPIEAVIPSIESLLQTGGFQVRHEMVECPGSRVLVVIASKAGKSIKTRSVRRQPW